MLNEASDFKFVARIWNIVNDQKSAKYHVGNEIIYNTEVSKSNLFEQNNAYILLKKGITVTAAPITQLSLKNCAPFTNWITTIDGTTIDTEDLDLVLPI